MPYDADFYHRCGGESGRSAQVIVPLVLERMTPSVPRSVVDVGCGTGAFLQAFSEHGVSNILGIDGPWADSHLLRIPRDCFEVRDLAEAQEVGRRFDLVVSLEVAEHLPEDRAAGFVGFLSGLGPAVLFSAAIPGQGGTHHLNEQWPDYWADLFSQQGFTAVDCLRTEIWSKPEVGMPYKQNMLMFIEADHLPDYAGLASAVAGAGAPPLPLVHPDLYLDKLDLDKVLTRHTVLPLLSAAVRKSWRMVARSVRGGFSRLGLGGRGE